MGPGPGGTGETQRLGQMGLHTQRTRWRCCVGLPGRALPPASPPSQGRPRPPQPGAACSSPALSPAALQVLLGSEVSEKHHSPLAPAFPLKRSCEHSSGTEVRLQARRRDLPAQGYTEECCWFRGLPSAAPGWACFSGLGQWSVFVFYRNETQGAGRPTGRHGASWQMGPGVLGMSLLPAPLRPHLEPLRSWGWGRTPPGRNVAPREIQLPFQGPPVEVGSGGRGRVGGWPQGEREALIDEGQGAEANGQGQEEGRSLGWGFTCSSAHRYEQPPGFAQGKRKAQGSARIELPLRA